MATELNGVRGLDRQICLAEIVRSSQGADMAVVGRQYWRRHFQHAQWHPFAVLVFIELLFALALLRSPGTSDVPIATMDWIAKLSEHGLVRGYGVIAAEYPPFS